MRSFGDHTELAPGVTLLEASAGTGKTYQITSLVLRLLTEASVPARELLLVTFTRAATAELRERVRLRIAAAAAAFADPRAPCDDATIRALIDRAAKAGAVEGWRGRLVAAQENIDQLTVSTIHGFCQRMLQQNAFESGVAFGEELVQDERELLEALVDDYLSGEINAADRSSYLELSGSGLFTRDRLLALARVAASDPEIAAVPAAEVDAAARLRALGALAEALATGRAEIEAHYAAARAKGGPLGGSRKWSEARLGAELDALEAGLARAAEGAVGVAELLAGTGYFAPDPKKYPAFELPAALATLLAELRRLDDGLAVARARFVAWMRAGLERRHRAAKTQSFQDLVRRLAEAVDDSDRGPAVIEAIGGRYRAALIDEFQDTDAAQWRIFSRCFADARHYLFLIGDPKQAIYGFRGADVRVYLAARGEADAAYTMDRNYRSDAGYVRALNALYAPEGPGSVGANTALGGPPDGSGIVYAPVDWVHGRDPEARLRGPAEALDPAPLQLRWCALGGTEAPGPASRGAALRALVPRVAEDILALLECGAELHAGGDWRPLGPGDLAVLVRTGRQAEAIEEALMARGVPAVRAGAGNVFESEEARAMELWLTAVEEAGSDRAARAAAITPIFGWTAEGLGRLDDDMPDAVRAWADWIEALGQARREFLERGFMAALRRCMDRFDVARRVLELERGARRLTNFLHVAELVHAGVMAQRLRITGARRWLAERRADPSLEGEAAELRLEGDEAAVRVVTVHASKGLQYPVVFVPFAWSSDLHEPGRGPLVAPHPSDPVGRVLDLHVDPQHPERAASLERYRDEAQREGARLLYVALTRAQSRCVLYDAHVTGQESSSLACLLHAAEVGAESADRIGAASRRVMSLGDDALVADLRAIAARSAEIGWSVGAPTGAQGLWTAPGVGAGTLRVRDFGRFGLDLTWGRSSFTALVREAGRSEATVVERMEALDARLEGLDHDAESPVPEEAFERVPGLPDLTSTPELSVPVPLGAFPAGARAGTFLHAIYERADFTPHAPERPDAAAAALEELGELAVELAATHGMRLDAPAIGPEGGDWARRLPEALAATLCTPLGGPLDDLRLCDLPRERRLDELRFDLPVAGGNEHRARRGPAQGEARHAQAPVRDRELVAALRAAPADAGLPSPYLDRLDTLGFGRIAGYLTGSIDLVFATQAAGDQPSRWYLADYKSNRLDLRREGHVTLANYGPAWMEAEMAHHHYYLQLHLYTLALHRYLRHRLPGYDYDLHFGGAYYLFVRGMVGPQTPCDDRGRRYGVSYFRPHRRVLEALDVLFERREPEA